MCLDPGTAPGQGLQCGQPSWGQYTSSFQDGCVGGFLLALQHPWTYIELTMVLLASGSHPHPGCATREVRAGVILTCYDQLGVEEPGVLLQPVIVDVTSLGVDLGEEGSATSLW